MTLLYQKSNHLSNETVYNFTYFINILIYNVQFWQIDLNANRGPNQTSNCLSDKSFKSSLDRLTEPCTALEAASNCSLYV